MAERRTLRQQLRSRTLLYRLYQLLPLRVRAWMRSAAGLPTPELEARPWRVRPRGGEHYGSPYISGFSLLQRQAKRPTLVAVPVYGQPEAVERCVTAVLAGTDGPFRVLVIDDGSPDEETAHLLSGLAEHPAIEVLRFESNRGYTHAINAALDRRRDGEDVALLNSDTFVMPGWLGKLRQCLHSRTDIATVTAVGDAAEQFSIEGVPSYAEVVRDPEAGEHYARAVAATGLPPVPSPTAMGFCTLIRAEVLAGGAKFDADAFPRGYGEENDFCLGLSAAGWKHVIDFRTVVYHAESLSLGSEKEALLRAGQAELARRWPHYGRSVQEFLASPALISARGTVAAAADRAALEPRNRKQVLLLQHDGVGGAAYWLDDLARGVAGSWEAWALIAAGPGFDLLRWEDPDGWVKAERYRLSAPVDPRQPEPIEYADLLAWIDYRLPDLDLVHISHLLGHSLEAPALLHEAGLPVAMTLHDYFMVCPTAHLLDENGTYCAGTCTPSPGRCQIQARYAELEGLKHGWIHPWQARALEALTHLEVVVAPHASVLAELPDRYRATIDGLPHGARVIPHGLDVDKRRARHAMPGTGATTPLRAVAVGNIGPHKGGDLLAQLKARLPEIEIHVLGAIHPDYQGVAHEHGPFQREELPAKLEALGPDVGLLLSTWPETYSYVLTELWANGIPVVGSQLGAIGARIRASGMGWTFDPTDPADLVEVLSRVPGELDDKTAAVDAWDGRGVHEMALDYQDLWEEILSVDGRERSGELEVEAHHGS